MQLLYRINQTGTTVMVATHDVAMVDKMRRRVIELRRRQDRPRRAGRRLRRPREHARVRHPHAERPGMRPVFFLREALRALKRNAIPSFAAMATVLVTVLVLGVFLPVVQATTGAANEVRNKVIADVYLKADVKQADIDRVGRLLKAEPLVGNVEFISKEQALQDREEAQPEGVRAARLQPAAGHLPRHPGQAGRHRQAQGRARAAGPGRRHDGRRPRDRRGPEPRGGHEQDPLGDARREDHDGAAARPAGRRVGAADRQHDPPRRSTPAAVRSR